MPDRRRHLSHYLLAACTLAGAVTLAHAGPAGSELVVLVDTATEMPMARFDRYRLAEGIHKDVGEALAAALGRSAKFLVLPRKRIPIALEKGDADVLCGYEPAWLSGTFVWSQPFMNQVEVVLTDRGAVRPPVLPSLASQPIGTVAGFTYPQLAQALDGAFVRSDAPSVEINLAKLAVGRLHHMVAMQNWFDYRQRLGDVKVPLHPPLVVAVYQTRCALSPKSGVSPRELDRALERLVADGSIAAIAARYK